MKLALYRENPYAKVPLVTSNCDYDVTGHETAPDAYGVSTATQQRASYKSPGTVDGSNADLLTMQNSTDREAIEMNMVSNVRNTLRKKPDGMMMGGGGGGSNDPNYGHVGGQDSLSSQAKIIDV